VLEGHGGRVEVLEGHWGRMTLDSRDRRGRDRHSAETATLFACSLSARDRRGRDRHSALAETWPSSGDVGCRPLVASSRDAQ
jgi:hypothetical protein